MIDEYQKHKIQRDKYRVAVQIENKRIKKQISDKNLKREKDLREQRKRENENFKKIADLERLIRKEILEKENEERKLKEIASLKLIIAEQNCISNNCREDRFFLQKTIQNKQNNNEDCIQEIIKYNESIVSEILANNKQMAAIMSERQKTLKETKHYF